MTPDAKPTASPTILSQLTAGLLAMGGVLGLVACGDDSAPAGATTTATGTGGAGAGTTTVGGGGTGGSGAGGSGGSTGGTGGSGGTDPGYPPPPYGNQVNDTFPLVEWEGHVNLAADGPATSQPYVDWSSDDVRTSGSSHALVHLAATF